MEGRVPIAVALSESVTHRVCYNTIWWSYSELMLLQWVWDGNQELGFLTSTQVMLLLPFTATALRNTDSLYYLLILNLVEECSGNVPSAATASLPATKSDVQWGFFCIVLNYKWEISEKDELVGGSGTRPRPLQPLALNCVSFIFDFTEKGKLGLTAFLQEFCAFFSSPWVSDSLVNVELSCRLTCTIPSFFKWVLQLSSSSH